MTFLAIFIAIAIEFVIFSAEALRSTRWIGEWSSWLNTLCGSYRWWRADLAVLITIALPLIGFGVVFHWVNSFSGFLMLLLSVAILIWSFGPLDLNREIETYLKMFTDNDSPEEIAVEISFLKGLPTQGEQRESDLLGALLGAAHNRIFAVLFWFCLLGPLGAILFRMSATLHCDQADGKANGKPHGEDARNAFFTRLYQVLIWIPARLYLLGLGLAGTLVPVLDAFTERHSMGFDDSESLIAQAGLAASGYGEIGRVTSEEPHVYWVNSIQALIKRAFTVWLVLLASFTLLALRA